MASKIKVDQIQTGDGTGTIALQNQLSGMTSTSMPTGSVLQVVHALNSSITSSTSSTYVSTGITATITPTSTSSKILVMTKITAVGTTSTDVNTKLFRGSGSITTKASTKYNNQGSEPSDIVNIALDSPNTTSATTYALYGQSSVNGQAITFKVGSSEGTITLMEIAG